MYLIVEYFVKRSMVKYIRSIIIIEGEKIFINPLQYAINSK